METTFEFEVLENGYKLFTMDVEMDTDDFESGREIAESQAHEVLKHLYPHTDPEEDRIEVLLNHVHVEAPR